MAQAVERAYDAIREGIVKGTFRPGAHITAQDLAAATGLSRTPVREAMRRLHAEGLIRIIPNRGAFVGRWSVRGAAKEGTADQGRRLTTPRGGYGSNGRTVQSIHRWHR